MPTNFPNHTTLFVVEYEDGSEQTLSIEDPASDRTDEEAHAIAVERQAKDELPASEIKSVRRAPPAH